MQFLLLQVSFVSLPRKWWKSTSTLRKVCRIRQVKLSISSKSSTPKRSSEDKHLTPGAEKTSIVNNSPSDPAALLNGWSARKNVSLKGLRPSTTPNSPTRSKDWPSFLQRSPRTFGSQLLPKSCQRRWLHSSMKFLRSMTPRKLRRCRHLSSKREWGSTSTRFRPELITQVGCSSPARAIYKSINR